MKKAITIEQECILHDNGVWHGAVGCRVPNRDEMFMGESGLESTRLKLKSPRMIYEPLHPPIPAGYHIGSKPDDAPAPVPEGAEVESAGGWVAASAPVTAKHLWYIFRDEPAPTEDADLLTVTTDAEEWMSDAIDKLIAPDDSPEHDHIYAHKVKGRAVLAKLRDASTKARGGHPGGKASKA